MFTPSYRAHGIRCARGASSAVLSFQSSFQLSESISPEPNLLCTIPSQYVASGDHRYTSKDANTLNSSMDFTLSLKSQLSCCHLGSILTSCIQLKKFFFFLFQNSQKCATQSKTQLHSKWNTPLTSVLVSSYVQLRAVSVYILTVRIFPSTNQLQHPFNTHYSSLE